MSFFIVQFLAGMATASTLFLVACGLSIIFGVTRVVNFAHGSFYMLGAYVAYTLVGRLGGSVLGFWTSLLLAAASIGLIGVFIETVLLRRIYKAPELFQLLATFGVALVIQDLTLIIWGPEDLLGPRAPGLDGAIEILGRPFPQYDLVLIFLGPLILLLLWILFRRTRWGTLVRAATQDREMAGALGVNQAWLFTGVFFLGSILAGLGGALQIPRAAVNLEMDLSIIAEAFVVVVIGGMGSVQGAFLAALLIGELQAFGILLFPNITLVLPFLVMAVVLVVRPWGLLGRPEMPTRGHELSSEQPLRLADRRLIIFALGVGLFLIISPAFIGEYALVVLTDIFVFILFATSLHFLMGAGGMVSFGHAAYFGLGAYGAALLVHYLSFPMGFALVGAPIVAGIGALIFGWFCVRLSGVYLAMLTMAFAQITWSVAFQWYDFTGGDNGILGIWPSDFFSNKWAYYYLTLALCGIGIYLIRRAIYAPFGYTLRACRDSPLRSDSIGINLKKHRWFAFSFAGIFAGLGGGIFAFAKGSVFPSTISIPKSIDGLVMVLLGGLQTVSGPIVGGAVFTGLQNEILRHTDYWRMILGIFIIVLVLMFPYGIVGFIQDRFSSEK